MIYRVYTDAATRVKEGYSSIAFLILKGNLHVKCGYFIINESNTAAAEAIAVGYSLRYIYNNIELDIKDEIHFYSDSKYTYKYCKNCLDVLVKGKETKNMFVKPITAYWLKDIYNYIPKIKCILKFHKIKSHTSGKSPNAFVDRLAKIGLENK